MRLSLALFAAVALAWSGNVAAQSNLPPRGENYFAFRAGAYVPQSNDLDAYNTGVGADLAVGRKFNPNLALEFGLGSFWIATDEVAFVDAFGPYTDKWEARAIPLTATAKGILPAGALDVYVLGGLGMYFVDAKFTQTDSIDGWSESWSDSDTALGLHFGGGAAIAVNPQWKLAFEMRYHVAKATLFNVDTSLDGLQLSGGLQFAF